jgi:hypothetical protein
MKGRRSAKWTAERKALLARLYPAGAQMAEIAKQLNLLPGAPIGDRQAQAYAAGCLGLRRPAPENQAPPDESSVYGAVKAIGRILA